MKWMSLASLAVLFFAAPSLGRAQNPQNPSKSSITISPGELSATPEMWFYEQQLRMYMDPKMMVRQKAEFRTAERQRRLESMRWYGMSNMRPRIGTDPVYGEWSPRWVSGNSYHPNRWSAWGPWVAVVPRSTYSLSSD